MRSVTRVLFPVLIVVLAVGIVHAAKGRVDPYVAGINGVTPPSPVRDGQVAPAFPVAARGRAIQAAVVVSTVVRADGSVASVEVLDCDAPGYGFEDSVRTAVSRWRFEPGMWNGRPVDTVSKFRIRVGQPLESAAEMAGRLIDPSLRLFALPIAGGAIPIGTPGGSGMFPTFDPGSLNNRPVAAARSGCSPGQTPCLYQKNPGGPVGDVIEPLRPRPGPGLPIGPGR